MKLFSKNISILFFVVFNFCTICKIKIISKIRKYLKSSKNLRTKFIILVFSNLSEPIVSGKYIYCNRKSLKSISAKDKNKKNDIKITIVEMLAGMNSL